MPVMLFDWGEVGDGVKCVFTDRMLMLAGLLAENDRHLQCHAYIKT